MIATTTTTMMMVMMTVVEVSAPPSPSAASPPRPASFRDVPSCEVARQTVTARELASSPPAPSPSKRPKRAGPQFSPQELTRLAAQKVAHLDALLDGSDRPFPGPVGLDEPISVVSKFVKDAHTSWVAVSHGRASSFMGSFERVVHGNRGGLSTMVIPPSLAIFREGLFLFVGRAHRDS